MNDAYEALAVLARMGIRLEVRGDDVYLDAQGVPIPASISARVTELRDDLLCLLREDENQDAGIVRVPDRVSYPVTSQQRRLFAIQNTDPSGVAYNIPSTYELLGDVIADQFRHALMCVMDCNTILRTTYFLEDGELKQKILSEFALPFEFIDAIGQHDARDWSDFVRPFDLEYECPIRARLIRTDERRFLLQMDVHHIAADGACYGDLIEQMLKAYHGEQLTPEKLRYVDFAVWQLESRRTKHQEDREYWLNHFKKSLPSLELPSDFVRPPSRSYLGASHSFKLSTDCWSRLTSFAKTWRATPQMVLLAIWKVLLSRLGGIHDICVGIGSSGRDIRELESVCGMFVNTLALRSATEPDLRFVDYVQNIRNLVLEALDHQSFPFEELIDELDLVREKGRQPGFDTMFTYAEQTTGTRGVDARAFSGETFGSLKVTRLFSERHVAKFDLTLYAVPSAEGLRLSLEYATELFSAETAERIGQKYRFIAEQVACNPELPLGKLTLLEASEREQVLHGFNMNKTLVRKELCVHQWFEEIVDRHPGLIALQFGRTRVSYRELDERSNRLAHWLRDRCRVEPDSLIAICCARSLEFVIGAIAVLKAGCAYLPVDISWPPDRQSFVLRESQVSVVLVSGGLAAGASFAGKIVDLTKPDNYSASKARLPHRSNARNLAYAIYTSGSSGLPKSVLIEHANLSNLVTWHHRQFGTKPGERSTMVAGTSFDASVWELWPALCAAGELHILPEKITLQIDDYRDYLSRHNISTAFLPTPLCEEYLRVETEPPLRVLLTGGDRLHRAYQMKTAFYNNYGPTECTVVASSHAVTASEKRPAIGGPIANVRLYVLDERGAVCPIGIPGELYIGGAGLGRGYFGRPDLTAERFVADWLGEEPGARLYRTGDLVRWRTDGALDFIGRIDSQVKIDGHRIELGEIESVLLTFDGVADAVVDVSDSPSGLSAITAYVVPGNPSDDNPDNDLKKTAFWQTIFNDAYAAPESEDAQRNWTGWNSSYTGKPYSEQEMDEWTEATVSRIKRLAPRRVLEIGCGTGLLLFRVAPGTSRYVGTDISRVAIRDLQSALMQSPELSSKVEVFELPAHDLSPEKFGSFDTVIVNSVVQYMPGLTYLDEVLNRAWSMLSEGGTIFVGDVLNYSMLSAFHASVCFYNSTPDLSAVELRQKVQDALLRETELFVSPDYFRQFVALRGNGAAVLISPKETQCANEMSRFRYDVEITKTGWNRDSEDLHGLEWKKTGTADDFKAVVENPVRLPLRISGIPNPLSVPAVNLWQDLRNLVDTRCSARLKTVPGSDFLIGSGITPKQAIAIARKLGYHARCVFSDDGGGGLFDVIVGTELRPAHLYERTIRARDFAEKLSNDPQRAGKWQGLTERLEERIKAILPSYMVPAHFVLVDSFPLNASGKVNRRALPKPTGVYSHQHVPPRDAIERALASLFSEVLGIDRVGITDRFFDLGGHSIKAIRLLSLIKQRLRASISFENLVEFDLAQLAVLIRKEGAGPRKSLRTTIRSFVSDHLDFFRSNKPGA